MCALIQQMFKCIKKKKKKRSPCTNTEKPNFFSFDEELLEINIDAIQEGYLLCGCFILLLFDISPA